MTKYYFAHPRFLVSKNALHYCLSVFFNVYFFIVFFDIMRDALPFSGILNALISGMRDMSLYLIVIYVLYTKKVSFWDVSPFSFAFIF